MKTSRTFHCTESGSSKFWTIATSADGKNFTVTYGKIGTAGQSKEKSFPSAEACANEAAKLIREKTGKGYIEQGAAKPSASAAMPTTKPASSLAEPTEAELLEILRSGDETKLLALANAHAEATKAKKSAKTVSSVPSNPKSTIPNPKSKKPVAKLPPYDERDTKQQRAFLRAIRSGDLDKIRAYVESGARLRQMIFETKMDSTYPFLAALENPQPEIIRYFITLPDYHPTYTGSNQSVLTSIATDYEIPDADRLAKIELLLDCGYDCSRDDDILIQLPNFILPEDLVRKIHDRASRARDTGDVIFEALQWGGDIRCDWITTPWKPNPVTRLLYILDHGLRTDLKTTEKNAHPRDAFGSTLHTVLQLCYGHKQLGLLIAKLLEKGANPLAKDKSKLLPWEYAETSPYKIPPAVIAHLRKAAETASKK